MATKKTQKNIDDSLDPVGNEAELENAIDGLRGVLKQDAEGSAGGFDFDDVDAPESNGLPAIGSDFGDDDLSSPSFGDSGFGGGFEDTSPPAQAAAPGSALNANIGLIMDIPIDVQIVLGSSRMQVSGLMNLTEGAIIALDKKIGEPVEITVNGRRIARGEITVLENDDTRFGVKLIEVLSVKKA